MARKGYRKYVCDECRAESWHHWIERNRASRLRCTGCGSARLELVSDEAKDEAADLQAVRVGGGTPSTTREPGFARGRRKVT